MGLSAPGAPNSRTGKPLWRFTLVLILLLFAPLAFMFALAAPPPLNWAWDWANAAGYLAIAIGLILFVYYRRPRGFAELGSRFVVNLHRQLGFAALLLVIAHIVALLILEPLVLEYLKLSAPLYMLAGLIAAVLLLLLVLSALSGPRKKLWPDYNRFRNWHAGGAILMTVLVYVHVVGSEYYAARRWQQLLVIAPALLVLGIYAFLRRQSGKPTPASHDIAVRARVVGWGSAILVLIAASAWAFARSTVAAR